MASSYDQLFQELVDQIRDVSLQTAELLHELRDKCSPRTAYYATFIFICLEAQRETNPELHRSDEIDVENLRSFTFFEAAKDQPDAQMLFEAALACYKHDISRNKGLPDTAARFA